MESGKYPLPIPPPDGEGIKSISQPKMQKVEMAKISRRRGVNLKSHTTMPKAMMIKNI
jgi:hypothetical protein